MMVMIRFNLKGNLVLCSHEHDDHNARDCVDVLPKEFKVYPKIIKVENILEYILLGAMILSEVCLILELNLLDKDQK